MVTQQIDNGSLSTEIISQLEELERFSEFILQNPSLVGLPQMELENIFLEQRTTNLSGGTLPAIVVGGVGEENAIERNRLLHDRLQMLKAVRARDGRTVGDVLASRTEFGGGFLFPAITDAFEADPSSNAALFAFAKQLFTSPVGIPEDPRARSIGLGLNDLPAPVRVLTSAAQTTASPGSVILGVAGPGLLATRITPQSSGLAKLLADTPGRAVLADFIGNVGADVAAELNAPPVLQFAAGLVSGFGTGQLADFNAAVRADGLRAATDAFVGPGALDHLGGAAREAALSALITSVPPAVTFELLSSLAQGDIGEPATVSEALTPIVPLPDFNQVGPLTPEQQELIDAFFERNPGVENLAPLEQESLFLVQEFERRGIQPIGNPIFGTQEFIDSRRRQLEAADLAEQRQRDQMVEAQLADERQAQRNAEITAPIVARLDEAMRALQFDAAGRTAAERTTEFSFESGIADVPVTQGSGPVFNTDAPDRLQAARDAAARAHQNAITANLDSAIRMDQEETATAARAQLARLNEARLTGSQQPVLSPIPSETSRISNTTRVGEGFGFGTRGANALAEVRERQQEERARLVGLPPSARGIGATDLAAEVAAETQLAAAKQAEEQASATRQVTEIAAAQAESDAEASRQAVRTAPTAREAVDRMDASREAEVRAERLRESARIAEEEERMLRDMRIRAQRLANDALAERRRREAEALAAAQEAARTEQRRIDALALAAANTTEVSSTSPFAASPQPERVSSFGFGTGAGDRLQAARDAAQAS